MPEDASRRIAGLYLNLLEERTLRGREGRDAGGVERALEAMVTFKVNSAVREAAQEVLLIGALK